MDEFDQIENEYLERVEARRAPSQPYPLVSPQPPQMPAIPLYDISLAQAPEQQAQQEPLLTRKVAGLPVWGWGLLSVAGLGLGIYAWKQSGKVESNPEPESERPEPRAALPASTGDWSPSRSRFGESLERWAKGRSIPASQITVYTDADEAKRHVKPVSPLVTLKCSTSIKVPMDELQKLCAEEGLCATDHGGGVIGFYPAESGSRAQEWESYIDALRDEGQTV